MVVVGMKEELEQLCKCGLQVVERVLVDCSLSISLWEALGRCADQPLDVVFFVDV